VEPTLELPRSTDVPTRLVEATIRLLAGEGPSAIKARTVASASGLSTMAVYSHFGGIPELLNAVIDEGFNLLGTAFSQLLVTDDPLADLCSMALTTRQTARENPHLYDLMFGLSKRATYRPLKDDSPSLSGGSPAFLAASDHVVAACARLVESGRVGDHDPTVLAGQLWSMVHGFVTLELSDHFAEFDDPVALVLLRLGTNLAVGLGDDRARAQASHELAARAHSHEKERDG
jgi:AcrR family transcriptional regulator